MRTELEARIAGEAVRVAVTIGVLEAVAEAEDDMVVALTRLQRGSLALTRVVIREGAKAAGRKDAGAWLDRAIEDAGLAPFAVLAFNALSDAFAKGAAAGKKAEAAAETAEAAAS